MAILLSMTSWALAGLAGSAAAAAYPGPKVSRQTTGTPDVNSVGNVTLGPISQNSSTPDPFTPNTNLTLSYGLDATEYVGVSLTTTSPGVLVETIDSVTAADCSADSVNLTFSSSETLDAAYAAWSSFEKLLLVTNHLGDCDSEFERGFFVAETWASDAATLSLLASAQKKTVTDVSSFMRANFTGIPTPRPSKRDIILDPSDVTIATTWDLPSLTLYEQAPYFTAKADSLSLDLAVTLGGYMDFNVLGLSLEALYVDVDTTTTADMVLSVNAAAPYNQTFSYSDAVGYYLVDVPGILTFGPELSFAVGAEVDVDAAVDVVLDLGAGIDNGTIHLDFVGDGTKAAGWEPTYHANLNLSEAATVGVAPFVAVTVGLDFKILGGLLDLSGGLTPKVEFPVTATLDAQQSVGAGNGTTVTVTQPGAKGCSNGVEVVSDFYFGLDAFVTEFWSDTLYNVTVPIAHECYSWT